MEQSRIEESVSVSSSSVDIFVLFRLGLSLTLLFLISPHLVECLGHASLSSQFCALEQQAPRRDG
jgi:hypothetical protein